MKVIKEIKWALFVDTILFLEPDPELSRPVFDIACVVCNNKETYCRHGNNNPFDAEMHKVSVPNSASISYEVFDWLGDFFNGILFAHINLLLL